MLLPSGDDRSDPIWGTKIPMWGVPPDAALRVLGDDDLVTPIDEEGERNVLYAREAGRIDPARPTPRGRGNEAGRIVRYFRSTSWTSVRHAIGSRSWHHTSAIDSVSHSYDNGQAGVVGLRGRGTISRTDPSNVRDRR